jgi:hypothetical protein
MDSRELADSGRSPDAPAIAVETAVVLPPPNSDDSRPVAGLLALSDAADAPVPEPIAADAETPGSVEMRFAVSNTVCMRLPSPALLANAATTVVALVCMPRWTFASGSPRRPATCDTSCGFTSPVMASSVEAIASSNCAGTPQTLCDENILEARDRM